MIILVMVMNIAATKSDGDEFQVYQRATLCVGM